MSNSICCKLRDLLRIKNGSDHKHLPDGNVPVYGSGGIMRHVNKAIYSKPSILLPRKGTLDNIQFARIPFWSVDTLFYTEVDTKKADPYFLYNLLRSLDMSRLWTGTGVPSMTSETYYNIEIRLPDLSTQLRIAGVMCKSARRHQGFSTKCRRDRCSSIVRSSSAPFAFSSARRVLKPAIFSLNSSAVIGTYSIFTSKYCPAESV